MLLRFSTRFTFSACALAALPAGVTPATIAVGDFMFHKGSKTVTTGVPKAKIKMVGAPFEMKPRGGIMLTDDQVRDVAAYVHSLSHH